MINGFGDFLYRVFESTMSMLNGASGWLITSFIVAGALHEFLNPERMQRMALGTKKLSGIIWASLSGCLLPICSCGTIPLGISLYYSGAYLGPTLAFMVSTPVLNPLAFILTVGLLGKEIAIIHVIVGIVGPLLMGFLANRLAGDELYLGLREERAKARLKLEHPELAEAEEEEGPICLEMDDAEDGGSMIQLEVEESGFWEKIKTGLRWSFSELAVSISKYTVTGTLLAGILFTTVPQSFIQDYLGNPGVVSLLGITTVAALMYV